MSDCPTRDHLCDYEHGRLSDSSAERLERHLDNCPDCRAMLGALRLGDTESRRLRVLFGAEGSQLLRGDAQDPRSAGDHSPHPTGDVGGAAGHAHDAASRADAHWPIPDYERVVLCGEGSYGSVWAVRDRIGVFRALKRIELDRLARIGARCRERDALELYCRRVARHPHLVHIAHVGLAGSTLYYTMELADDRSGRDVHGDGLPPSYRPMTLESVIADRVLRPDVAVEIARRLLRGLTRLHQNDLVHRDIKPSNIIFVNRQPKLADIGMITAAGPVARPLGTPRYMPPDQVMDRTADVYAMGRILQEMLHGPDGQNTAEEAVSSGSEGALWNLERVHAVIGRACADRADQRFPDAAAMLDDLESCGQTPLSTLFEEWERMEATAPRSVRHEAIQLGFATLRALPWIFGILALLAALYLLRNLAG